jgi:flagellar hook assembly protein FlgD
MTRLNHELIPPSSPGEFKDDTTWPETTFLYELRAVATDGSEVTIGDAPLAVTTGGRLVAVLHPPRPNPFESSTLVQLDVPSGDHPVDVSVYDVRGRVVRVLHNGPLMRGRHTLRWDGRDGDGAPVSSGVYFVRLVLGDEVSRRKMMLLK